MTPNQNRQMVIVTILTIGLVFACAGFIYSNILKTRYTNSLVDISQQGVVITSIKANELVKLPITIEGYLDGQGWTVKDGKVGTVEVFDANGKSIGGATNLTTSDPTTYPVHFKVTVVDRQWKSYIQTKTGTVKITSNSVSDGGELKSITIPVRFLSELQNALRGL